MSDYLLLVLVFIALLLLLTCLMIFSNPYATPLASLCWCMFGFCTGVVFAICLTKELK